MNRTKKTSRKYAELFDRPDHRRRMGMAEERERTARMKQTKGRMPVVNKTGNPAVQAMMKKQQARAELSKMNPVKKLLTRKGRNLRKQAR